MPMYVASGGAWRPVKFLRSGASPVRMVRVAQGGVWHDVFVGLSATATGGSYTQNIGNASTPRQVATAVGASVTVRGGSGSYSYQRSVTGSSAVQSVSLANANSPGCTVYATCSLNGGGSVSLQCVITDNANGYAIAVTTSTRYNLFNTA